MNRLFKTKKALLCVMAVVVIMTACESSKKGGSDDKFNSKESEEASSKFPVITGKGVAPFLLNASFLSIPPQGDYYDNIKLNRFYSVIYGDHVFEITEDELGDYYDDFGSDAEEILGYFGTGVVVQGDDTLLISTYDENGVITQVEVFSDKFHLENGIHVGLSSEELASQYNASFLTTDFFAGEAWMCYYVKGLPRNITLWATNVYDIFDDDDGFGVPIPSSGEETRSGCFFQYKIPMDLVKGSRLASIRILNKDYESYNP